MSVESFLRAWTERITKQRQELLAEAYGLNVNDYNPSWWARNYLKIFLYGFLGLSCFGCYYLGFVWFGRILAIILGLSVVQHLWQIIKKVWNWLKAYLQARKLSKAQSHLKKE